jgi:hypothetical protein
MAWEFWLSEAQWGAVGLLLPKNHMLGGHSRDRHSSTTLAGQAR